MTREAIIQKAIKTLNMLPADKAGEVADFADYILKKHEEYTQLKESEINKMSLSYAENSFKNDWDLEVQEENDYWNSFK
jgi:hypothetical protein